MATTGNREFPRLSGIPTLHLELPAIVRAAPEDELAIAIDDVAIDPQYLDAAVSNTTTVAVSSLAVTTPIDPVVETPAPVIPELPRSEDAYVRQNRSHDGTGVISDIIGKATFNRLSLPDSPRARARRETDRRIARDLARPAVIAVIARTGGTGRTTVSALLGMALAEARADHVLAFDASDERGTLAERFTSQTRATVADLVDRAASLQSFTDFQAVVSKDETGLDVLAAVTDPTSPQVLSARDHQVVTTLAERYYSVIVSDSGPGLSAPVVRAALDRADAVVVVTGGGVDEAHRGSETLTWLEANGYSALATNAVVAVNTGTQGTDLDQLEQIEAHFEARARAVARIPYDAVLTTGSVLHFPLLKPLTRDAARELAALVVDGLPALQGS